MKRLYGTIILTTIFVAAAALAFADGVRIEKNVVYRTVDGMDIKADIYIPEGEGPFPGLLYIHGGGFVAGSKDFKSQARVVNYFAQNGFIVMTADYRLLSQGGLFPNNTRDAKCALCWFKKNGPKYGLDPARVGVTGESAGGYMALMIAMTAGMPEFAADVPAAKGCDDSVVAAAPVYPPSDFTTIDNNLGRMIKSQMIKTAKIKDKDVIHKYMVDNSPVNYIAGAKPMLIIHGVGDLLVPVEQSRALNKKLKDAGKDVTYLELENAPHGFLSENFDTESARTAREAALAFFRKFLMPGK
jgi:acetyl esterase/lipase